MGPKQAEALAEQIFEKFDKRILEATAGTIIPPSFVAGLVANEAGKDRQGDIKEEATRFEPGIYRKFANVARTPGARWGSITHNHLKDATDASLRALCTSYEATQMMGWWCIVLGCTLADLKNPDKHFFYTVKALLANDQHDFDQRSEAAYDDEMRQWNTGREKGKTYHENYVPNAREIRAAYRQLEKSRIHRSIAERVNIPVDETVAPDTDLDPTLASNSSGVNELIPPPAKTPAGEGPGATGDGSSDGKDPAPSAETITQYVPTMKRAFRYLVPTSVTTFIGTAWAGFNGLPPYVTFLLGMVSMAALIGLIVLVYQHRAMIYKLVDKVIDNNADPTTPNAQIAPAPA